MTSSHREKTPPANMELCPKEGPSRPTGVWTNTSRSRSPYDKGSGPRRSRSDDSAVDLRHILRNKSKQQSNERSMPKDSRYSGRGWSRSSGHVSSATIENMADDNGQFSRTKEPPKKPGQKRQLPNNDRNMAPPQPAKRKRNDEYAGSDNRHGESSGESSGQTKKMHCHERGETEKREAKNYKRTNDSVRSRHEEPKEKKGTDTNSAHSTVAKPKEREVRPISYTALKKICLMTDKEDAMLEIARMEERYVALLNSKEEIREDLFKLVIDSFVVIFEATSRKFLVMCILRKTSQKFLRFQLPRYLQKLSDMRKETIHGEDLEGLVVKLIKVFEVMLQRVPQEIVDAVCTPILHLKEVVKKFHKEGLVKDDIKEQINKIKVLREDVKERVRNRGPNGENLKPPNDFREMNVVPDYTDFQPGTKPFLRANVIDSAYSNVEHYLDVQFRLLREDLIIPLRDGIRQLHRERKVSGKRARELETKKKQRKVFVYHDVKILNPVCNRDGGVYRIRIDVNHPSLKCVRWEKSKRLKFGALVCLSPDSFETLCFGAVENRDLVELKYDGELNLRFDNCNRQVMSQYIEKNISFQMVESESYFEAYKHNLSALQQLNEGNLPFKEYIVFGTKDVQPPKYLIIEDEQKQTQLEKEGNGNVMLEDHSLPSNKKPAEPEHLSDGEIESEDGNDLSDGEIESEDGNDLSDGEIESEDGNDLSDGEIESEDGNDLSDGEIESEDENDLSDGEIESEDGNDLSDGEIEPEHENSLSGDELDPGLFNLKSIADPDFLRDNDSDFSRVPILNLDQWPSKEALGLDESQYRACQLALTKRFALIQGPPGTGKTYVGLKIAQVLLDNSGSWSGESKSPILMVSYTNHALDQFLMGLKNTEDISSRKTFSDIVRVGGRSKEERLKMHNLAVLRRENRHFKQTLERSHIEHKINEIESMFSPKEASALIAQSDKAVLSVKELEKYMDPDHFNSFKPKESEQVCTYWQMDQKLLEWLEINMSFQDETRRRHDEKRVSEYEKLMHCIKEYMDDDEDHGNPFNESDCKVIDSDPTRQHERKSVAACYIHDAVEPDKLAKNLEDHRIMSEEETRLVNNIWKLRYHDRWKLYRLWRDRLQRDCRQRIIDSQDAGYETELKKLQENDEDVDYEIFRNSRVIAMTTTGAARCHSLLQRVRPKIVIVEEAAEVLEAHILTSLPLVCEHVILIGDHQQLRPSCTVYELAKKYKLNISMFERLVKLQMPCVRLSEQHRMRPEIASLMRHIYDNLHDHASVKEYDDIQGIQHNVFFIDHRNQEDDSEDSFSHCNEYEAQFLMNLCHYIIQQGYQPSQITILTPYLGQMFTIRDHLTSGDNDLIKQVRFSTIDNYQGEENDIILLSLVRSNETGHVGFVNDINRACVALSRARMGLYVIGNFKLLSEKSDIWKSVVDDLKKRGQFGKALPLRCQNHGEKKILVENPNDFLEKVPCGGCNSSCQYRLDCGHACKLSCHPFDPEHKDFRCLEKCTRSICENGHRCQKKCFESCNLVCSFPVDKELPCGHIKENVRCSDRLQELKCDVQCDKTLKCGHQCQARCGEPCTSACQELVKRNDWSCGHEVTIACSATPLNCLGPCGAPSCGHECLGHCGECLQGRVHKRCKKKCGRILVCGHECVANCTAACPPCSEKCETKCKHSECRRKCGEPCIPCAEPCEWKCEHLECNKRCGEICDRPRCDEPCRKDLQCGHQCRGLCNELCICVVCEKSEIEEMFGTEEFEDETVRFIQLNDCKHIFEVTALDYWIDMENDETTDPEKKSIQPKVCPLCKTPIRTSMRYNNVVKTHQNDIEKVKERIMQPFSGHERREKIRRKLNEYLRDSGGLPKTNSANSQRDRKTSICERLSQRISKAKTLLEIINIENQVNLLMRCRELIEKAEQTKAKISDKTSIGLTEISRSISILNFLEKKRIINSVEREMTDIALELRRQKIIIEVCSISAETEILNIPLASDHKDQLDDIRSTLSQGIKAEEPELDSYLKKIGEIRREYPINPPTREEKDQIIKAMGLSKGHWYKCPQGHIYAIGECGGAMERGTCPECKETIGGASHKLEEGNEVATEMDGAKYSAWSEQANMANYDLQE